VVFTPLQALLGELSLHEPIRERVRTLRTEGYRLGLINNNVREGSAAWRSMVPVDELFDAVIDSSEVGMRKPNPAIYQHALDALGGIPPEEAVFLDDSPGNVEGAKRAGLHAILVETPEQAIEDLSRILTQRL
jgi:putative hydrolase of the HAD superfamily